MTIQIRRLPRFQSITPGSVAEACSFLSKHKQEAKAVAGGTDLLIKMKRRDAAPKYLVQLKNLPELVFITFDSGTGLRIGSATAIHAIETSPIIREKFTPLAEAAYSIGSVQIRNRGTIGGNICNAVPSADTAPALLVLDARLTLVSPKGQRVVPINEFFSGPGKTILGDDELLMQIQIPPPAPNSAGKYIKHTLRRAMDLAFVGVAVWLTLKGEICQDVRIALGAVAPTPIRATKAEKILKGVRLGDSVIQQAALAAAEESKPISDIRSPAEYRTEMVKVLTKRAINEASKRIRGTP